MDAIGDITDLELLQGKLSHFPILQNFINFENRLSKKLCQADTAEDMINKYCKEFKVYPREKFYAIPWQNWSMFFNEADTEKVNELTKNSYVIHVWNKHSVGNRIPLKSTVPYTLFAEKYCPKVYRQCDIYF